MADLGSSCPLSRLILTTSQNFRRPSEKANVATRVDGSRGPTEYSRLKLKTMFSILFAIFMGLACPSNHYAVSGNVSTYNTNDGDTGGGNTGETGTGGDTGQNPPRP